MRIIILVSLLALLLLGAVSATDHYTFEHSEEMRLSGRIEWRDYGPAAFQESLDKNKPVFLMLTAPTWCYWCHVYTSDAYVYNEAVYPIINNDYVPIYVDADKRQDLTRQYLEGGWPSTTIFAPSRERLFGYSGPRPIPWMQENLQRAAQYVSTQQFQAGFRHSYQPITPIVPTNNDLQNMMNNYAGHILGSHDSVHGGFGTGQKFPQGRALDFSLDLFELTGNQQFLDLVSTTLTHQYTDANELETNYNLFDPLDGGFHRYGTTREWTPPHYEKMLYDNVRLLQAYHHLLQLEPDNQLADEVVTKTLAFIDTKWYDHEQGGFYANSDVHGEDAYYGQNPRSEDKPRVEQTKYTDWNSDAIVAYLALWQRTQDQQFLDKAQQTLDFFEKEMITDQGAYHFVGPDNVKGVRGTLLDNAYALLAFTEAAIVLENQEYQATAITLADYSLANLYDWNSGGFFERNSEDTELYAPGEHIALSKPSQENGIISYALLRLYTLTNDPAYLNAAIKTIGGFAQSVGTLDRGYYFAKAAQFAVQENLVDAYHQQREEITNLESIALEDFWLTILLENQDDPILGNSPFQLSNQGLEQLEGPLVILLLISFIAGVLSFASPCSLPILPAYVAHTFRASKQNVTGLTISFFLGLSLVFTLLGMGSTLVGSFLRSNLTIFSQIAGAVIVVFGILMIFGKGFSGIKQTKAKPTTYFGSFLFGASLSIAWTPCVGPILVAIFVLASTTGSVAAGGLLLFVYALGLALPLLILSKYLDSINKQGRFWKFVEGKNIEMVVDDKTYRFHSTSVIAGIIFIILGVLIFSGALFAFNQYIGTTSLQAWIFGLEDVILSWIA